MGILKEGDINLLKLTLCSLHARKSQQKLATLESMPFKQAAWAPFISAGKFALDPNADILAQELKWLSENWDIENSKLVTYRFLWPLASCLAYSNSREDLFNLSERVSKGYMGCIEEWKEAEKRWLTTGIQHSDIAEMTDSRWPFDKYIANSGFPFCGSELHQTVGAEEKQWNFFCHGINDWKIVE